MASSLVTVNALLPAEFHNLPPFIQKLWEMVNLGDGTLKGIVEWGPGSSVLIENPEELTLTVLPQFFRHNNLASFTRQLNWYGFSKVNPAGSATLEFRHPKFVKGRPDLLPEVKRRNKGMEMPELDVPIRHSEGSNKASRSSERPRKGRATLKAAAATASGSASGPASGSVSGPEVEETGDYIEEDGYVPLAASIVSALPDAIADLDEGDGQLAAEFADHIIPAPTPALATTAVHSHGVDAHASGHHSELQKRVEALELVVQHQQQGLQWFSSQLKQTGSHVDAMRAGVEDMLYNFYCALENSGFEISASEGGGGMQALQFAYNPPVSAQPRQQQQQPQSVLSQQPGAASSGPSPVISSSAVAVTASGASPARSHHLKFPDFKRLILQSGWWPDSQLALDDAIEASASSSSSGGGGEVASGRGDGYRSGKRPRLHEGSAHTSSQGLTWPVAINASSSSASGSGTGAFETSSSPAAHIRSLADRVVTSKSHTSHALGGTSTHSSGAGLGNSSGGAGVGTAIGAGVSGSKTAARGLGGVRIFPPMFSTPSFPYGEPPASTSTPAPAPTPVPEESMSVRGTGGALQGPKFYPMARIHSLASDSFPEPTDESLISGASGEGGNAVETAVTRAAPLPLQSPITFFELPSPSAVPAMPPAGITTLDIRGTTSRESSDGTTSSDSGAGQSATATSVAGHKRSRSEQ